jgi:hypothetical protein
MEKGDGLQTSRGPLEKLREKNGFFFFIYIMVVIVFFLNKCIKINFLFLNFF